MVSRFTLEDVLKMAIEKEIASRTLYLTLGQRVKDKAVENAFQELAEQEQGHRELLEKYLRGEIREGALGRGDVVDYKIAECLAQPEWHPDMGLQDVFLLAANKEKLSHDFYIGLARVHPAGKVKKLLKDLAGQELGHKRRVEALFTEVAFPQTDGG